MTISPFITSGGTSSERADAEPRPVGEELPDRGQHRGADDLQWRLPLTEVDGRDVADLESESVGGDGADRGLAGHRGPRPCTIGRSTGSASLLAMTIAMFLPAIVPFSKPRRS